MSSTFNIAYLPYVAPTNWELFFMFASVMLLVVITIGILSEKKH
jgi:hypothetical protein